MIRIDEVLTIQGVTVYRDEQRNKFYVLPDQPRFRLDTNGKPVFKFIKYRTPIDRQGGTKGGGFLIFDSEFVLDADTTKKVQSGLDDLVSSEKGQGPAQIGSLTYSRGTATLQLLDTSGSLVEKVTSAGKPSLFGRNIASFSAELSPEGATIIEAAMQGSGGVAQVIYDLHFVAKIPPLTAHVWFSEDKFYSYWQTIDKSDSHWWNGNSGSERDTRREQFRTSESGGVDLQFNFALPDADQDTKLKNQISDWAWAQLDDAVKRLVLSDPTANTDTGLPDGVNHVTRDFSTDKSETFNRYFTESNSIDWEIIPQGTLPNITSIAGVQWSDYAVTVDADDPFFKTLNVNVGVNADFAGFGINSVDVWVKYGDTSLDAIASTPQGPPPAPHFTSPDQRFAFASYIDANNWKYTYGYSVQFVGESRVYQSPPIETEAKVVTISVGDLGLLSVQVLAGTINFDQVTSAEVRLSYQDDANGVARIEQRYVLTKTNTQAHWLKAILVPRAKPYQYDVTYTMADTSVHTVAGLSSSATELYVDSPFLTKGVSFRSLGDFSHDMDTIFVDATYTDAANHYTQTKSIALTHSQPFFDWAFPALVGGVGVVTYSGQIKFQDATVEAIPMTTAAAQTIYLASSIPGLDVTIIPDTIDWKQVKLVIVHLQYADPGNNISLSKSIPVRAGVTPETWHVRLLDKTKNSFTWSATFYLNDAANSHRTSAPVTTTDTDVPPELPSA